MTEPSNIPNLESQLPILDPNLEVENYKCTVKPLKKKVYEPETWAKVQAAWESGKYSTRGLSKKFNIPQSTIQKRITVHKWEKGANIAQIAGSIAERNSEYFIRAGMAKENAIQLVVDGMTKPEVLKFEGKGDNMIVTPEPDYPTRLKFLQEYNKMVGNYAPMEKEGDKHVHFHVSEAKLKEMTASEQINYYVQMQDQ